MKSDGASLYHDEFGHAVTGAMLSQWSEKKYDKPIVLSTDHLGVEQIAELSQRMLIRCIPQILKNLKSERIHVVDSINEKQIASVERKLRQQCNDFGLPWPARLMVKN